ncbi:hypothetical protein [Streptomyces sp. bgisy084]|uniref:hypothetical protein n=1 Tax=Streptomyces sp. bgisy084 TaxID=3413777 RepID=UPI003D74BFFB
MSPDCSPASSSSCAGACSATSDPESLSRITRVFADLDEDRLGDQAPELCQLADEVQGYRRRLAEEAERGELPLADPGRPYGVLVIEAARLMEEFQYTCDVLRHHVGR